MKYVISLYPIAELVKLTETPSPLIVKQVNKKDLMISLLHLDAHGLWCGNNRPVYAYIMNNSFYDDHFAHFGAEIDDDGGLGDKIIELASCDPVDWTEYEKYCNMRKYALGRQLAPMIRRFCYKHNLTVNPYYGFELNDMTMTEMAYVEIPVDKTNLDEK